MPALSWPEIRNRATEFAREWRDEASEKAESHTFWNDFFEAFGVKRRRLAFYEQHVKKLPKEGKSEDGWIDLFWPGTMLAEHKSAGANLTAAFAQAVGYFEGISDEELPRYVVVSDFQRFRLYDLDDGDEVEFNLSELPSRISLFGFIAGYSKIKVRDEDPLNIRQSSFWANCTTRSRKTAMGSTKTARRAISCRCSWCACCSVCSRTTPDCFRQRTVFGAD